MLKTIKTKTKLLKLKLKKYYYRHQIPKYSVNIFICSNKLLRIFYMQKEKYFAYFRLAFNVSIVSNRINTAIASIIVYKKPSHCALISFNCN